MQTGHNTYTLDNVHCLKLSVKSHSTSIEFEPLYIWTLEQLILIVVFQFSFNHFINYCLIAVERESGSGGPEMSYCPQHGGAVAFVEGILHVNEEESPLFFCIKLIPDRFNSMDAAFDACLETAT